ncbi:Tubulin/FtsZ family protein isoform 1 [Hibiscus syriacus]|uniref:Tubulin/FtsZ family protein isoform 1 n=1 Tax=Hibiscus syriacus TaxID=106335 RepID=A0A6A2YSZ2_HIBSY|nr:protein BIC2-like [Hibiscus syriacus]KAE8682449.1 Tubulin/FtsZ family protein isoform 1 [Hibiscus syriacus]
MKMKSPIVAVNGGVLQGSALVPRVHCSDGNEKYPGRERLKRHREEVAGISIPDKWGKEDLLTDWMDYSSFDSLLAPSGLASALKALIAEGRRRSSQRSMRIRSIKHLTEKELTGYIFFSELLDK